MCQSVFYLNGNAHNSLTVDPLRGPTALLADLGPLFAAQAREEQARYMSGATMPVGMNTL